jgi:sigma-B regulation protein RsbU (phosphoserine phosphatase)
LVAFPAEFLYFKHCENVDLPSCSITSMSYQDIVEAPNAVVVEENKRLKRAVEELSILNDLARAIGASLNSQEIMQQIIHRSLRAVHAEQGVVTLVDQRAGDSMKTLVRSMVNSSDSQKFHFHQSLLGWMHLNKKPLLMNNPQNDERFHGVKFDPSIHSLLAVPLVVKSELKGILIIYNKKDGKKFSEEDQRLLAIIAAQSAQVVENARLYEEEQALLRMQEEVRLASQIQMDLLPKKTPTVPGYDVAGRSVPAQVVGGDYFDFISINNNRVVVCVGDVSGKGLPASLLMAHLQATLRAQASMDVPVRECVERSNTLLFDSTSSEKFVTLFYGVLDTEKHIFTYSNAGHNHPYVIAARGGTQTLEVGGPVLAVLPKFPYEQASVSLEVGDTLVMFSDGVTEAFDRNDGQFGEERLLTILEQSKGLSAREIIEKVISAVNAFAHGRAQADDITIVIVKRIS